VRVIVPVAPGGGADTMARLVAQNLPERLGQTFVVDNRPGAAGTIGLHTAARAAADGYTIAIISNSAAASSSMHGARLPYDLVKDFSPVIQAARQPFVMLAHPAVPATTTRQLIDLAKVKPGALHYGTAGTGGIQHLTGLLFSAMAGVQLTHVPYKGGALALTDLIGGQIQTAFIVYLTARPHIASGRVRALGVTSLKRSAALPDIPAIAETVPGFEVDTWFGFLAPARTPAAIVSQLNREISFALRQPDIRERLALEASEVVAGSPQDFGNLIVLEIAKWEKVIQQFNVKAD
jgi:tripartite-type tricarboxylate transporter receptor subunit TctC